MATKSKATDESTGFVRLRPRIILSLAVVSALGYFGHQLWQRYEPVVKQHRQYAITPEQINLPQLPPWLGQDFPSEVLRSAGLVGEMSLLDDVDSLAAIKNAFESSSWIESVGTVSKELPAGIRVEAVFREPVAAVQTIGRREFVYLPVDRYGIRLPETDLPMNQRVHLPRISGVSGQPSIGQAWNDSKVMSGIRLATALAEVWHTLWLVEIVPVSSAPMSAQGYALGPGSFEIRTRGGTRILWGAAPGEESAGESPFLQKLERLRNYAAENNNLHTIDGPKMLDVRRDLKVQFRTAQEKAALLAAQEKEKEKPTIEIAEIPDEESQTK